MRDENKEIIGDWVKPKLDWKAKVVCEDCNHGWMSELENGHAKPSTDRFNTWGMDVPIDRYTGQFHCAFRFQNRRCIRSSC